jgi:hypothetical protein
MRHRNIRTAPWKMPPSPKKEPTWKRTRAWAGPPRRAPHLRCLAAEPLRSRRPERNARRRSPRQAPPIKSYLPRRRHGSGRLATEAEALTRATFGARPRSSRWRRLLLCGQLREGSLLAARISTAGIAAPTNRRCAPRPTHVQRRFREAAARAAPAKPAARDLTKRRPKRRASKPPTKQNKKVDKPPEELCGRFAGKNQNTVKQYLNKKKTLRALCGRLCGRLCGSAPGALTSRPLQIGFVGPLRRGAAGGLDRLEAAVCRDTYAPRTSRQCLPSACRLPRHLARDSARLQATQSAPSPATADHRTEPSPRNLRSQCKVQSAL